MRFDKLSFGSIHIDGITRDFDMVIDGGEIRKRKKQPSKTNPPRIWTYSPLHRGGHTLEMPAAGSGYRSVWNSAGDERSEARSERRKVELLVVPTPQAIDEVGTERQGDEPDPPRDVLITGD